MPTDYRRGFEGLAAFVAGATAVQDHYVVFAAALLAYIWLRFGGKGE